MTTLPFLPVFLSLALRRAVRRWAADRQARTRLRSAAAELRGMDARSLADIGIGASEVPGVLALSPAAVPVCAAAATPAAGASISAPPQAPALRCVAGCAA